jgi:hypothetical protein
MVGKQECKAILEKGSLDRATISWEGRKGYEKVVANLRFVAVYVVVTTDRY